MEPTITRKSLRGIKKFLLLRVQLLHMRELLIKVEDTAWERMKRVAERLDCSVEEFASRVLQHSLSRSTPPAEEWRQAMEALLQQVHTQSARFTPEEIEEDIKVASKEYRDECGL